MSFALHHPTTKVPQPGERVLHDPETADTPQSATIRKHRNRTRRLHRTHWLDLPFDQNSSQAVAGLATISDQSVRSLARPASPSRLSHRDRHQGGLQQPGLRWESPILAAQRSSLAFLSALAGSDRDPRPTFAKISASTRPCSRCQAVVGLPCMPGGADPFPLFVKFPVPGHSGILRGFEGSAHS